MGYRYSFKIEVELSVFEHAVSLSASRISDASGLLRLVGVAGGHCR